MTGAASLTPALLVGHSVVRVAVHEPSSEPRDTILPCVQAAKVETANKTTASFANEFIGNPLFNIKMSLSPSFIGNFPIARKTEFL